MSLREICAGYLSRVLSWYCIGVNKQVILNSRTHNLGIKCRNNARFVYRSFRYLDGQCYFSGKSHGNITASAG